MKYILLIADKFYMIKLKYIPTYIVVESFLGAGKLSINKNEIRYKAQWTNTKKNKF